MHVALMLSTCFPACLSEMFLLSNIDIVVLIRMLLNWFVDISNNQDFTVVVNDQKKKNKK